MTVSKNTPVNNYTGNGSNTKFDFDFLINSASELVVEKTKSDGEQVTLTNNVDYTIQTIGDKDGSYITFPITGSTYSVLGSDEKITLSLSLNIEQDKEYKNSSKLNLEVLEDSLDYLTRIAQIQERKIERSVKIAEGAVVTTKELGQNVNVIADNIEAINAVNSIKSDVSSVAGASSNISAVAGAINDVSSVAAKISDVSSVAEISSDLETLSEISSDIEAISGAAEGINLVASNMNDVNTCADNIEDIQTACGNLVYFGEDEPSDSYKLWIDPTGDSDPHFTSSLNTKLTGIEAGAEVNVIEDVKVNGVSLTVSNKAVDITVPTNTNQLTNGAGFLTSSDISGKQDTLVSGTNIKTINNASVLGSGNIDTKSEAISVLSGTSITLVDNSINTLTPSGNTKFTLPMVSDTTVFHQILVQLNMETLYTITLGTTTYFGGSAPDLSQTGNYNLIYEYDNALSAWVVGSIAKGA